MSLRKRLDLARRVLNLTIQLDARAGELRDAHKQVAYWQQLAGQRWDDVQRLNAAVNEAKAEQKPQRGMGDIVPSVVHVSCGSRDAANALALADRNAELHTEIGRAERRAFDAEKALEKLLADGAHADHEHDLERAQWAAERQHLVDQIEALKGNPS